jgi:hypothetical protein
MNEDEQKETIKDTIQQAVEVADTMFRRAPTITTTFEGQVMSTADAANLAHVRDVQNALAHRKVAEEHMAKVIEMCERQTSAFERIAKALELRSMAKLMEEMP